MIDKKARKQLMIKKASIFDNLTGNATVYKGKVQRSIANDRLYSQDLNRIKRLAAERGQSLAEYEKDQERKGMELGEIPLEKQPGPELPPVMQQRLLDHAGKGLGLDLIGV